MGGIVQMQTLTCFRQSVTYTCMIASEHGPVSESKKRDQYGVISSTSDGTWIGYHVCRSRHYIIRYTVS